MNKSALWQQYEIRLARVYDYIHDHLDDDLDMDALAEIACLSSYHWHKIYRAAYNETITSTIKRLRLSRAAGELIGNSDDISTIAKRAGYPNQQSFNRTFKDVYHLPPGKYRTQNQMPRDGADMFKVEFTTMPAQIVAGISFQGAYQKVGFAYERLNAIAADRNLCDQQTKSIGIYYDDPDLVEESELRSFACLTVASGTKVEEPLEMVEIPGGDYAVFCYDGPHSQMSSFYRWMYGAWLQTSEREIRDHPGFAHYVNPFETSPSKLKTDIYLPLV